MADMDNKFRERGLSLFTDGFCRDAPVGCLYSRRIGTVPENSGLGAEKGFSLIEVLIITAIIGILTTIAVMNFGGIIDSYKVRGAASHLYSEMQMARLKAVKEGKEWAVERVDTSYCIKRKVGTDWDSGCDIGGEDTVDEIIKTINLSTEYSGVKVCNSTRINFKPNGTAGMAGGTAPDGIRLSKGNRVQRVYITSTGTGNVRVENLDVSSACP